MTVNQCFSYAGISPLSRRRLGSPCQNHTCPSRSPIRQHRSLHQPGRWWPHLATLRRPASETCTRPRATSLTSYTREIPSLHGQLLKLNSVSTCSDITGLLDACHCMAALHHVARIFCRFFIPVAQALKHNVIAMFGIALNHRRRHSMHFQSSINRLMRMCQSCAPQDTVRRLPVTGNNDAIEHRLEQQCVPHPLAHQHVHLQKATTEVLETFASKSSAFQRC